MNTTKLSFILIALVLTLNSCGEKIICKKAKGAAVTETIELPPIDGIDLSVAANVNLTYGEAQSITVTAQQEVLDELERDVRGTTWYIHFDNCINNYKDFTIDITMPELTKIDISGSGDVYTTNTFVEQGNLELAISGSGDLDLAFEGGDIDSRISGSGDVKLEGTATSISQRVSGSGSLEAFDMPCQTADFNVSGSGSAEVTVSESLDVKISGSGSVSYKGEPALNVEISGSGEVINAN